MLEALRGPLACSLSCALLAGCASANDDGPSFGEVQQALSVCGETVPAERYIDGLPAYAQCGASENSPIYSNNGVDTSTSSLGADWIRTQYSGGYQCTELAHRYWRFVWNVSWLPSGNAGQWCDSAPPAGSGVVQRASSPVHGDLIVLAPGTCGAGQTTGHVAVIDTVDAARAQITVVQQNYASRSTYAESCAKCYLHVVANTAGAGGAPSGTGGAGGSLPGTGAVKGCSVVGSGASANAELALGLLATVVSGGILARRRRRRLR